jgi:hypothetical protein
MEDELGYIRRMIGIIQQTALDKSVDLFSLTMPDLRKVLLAHRINSVGSLIELVYTCKCREDAQSVKYDLMNLGEKEIDASYVEPYTVGTVQVRFPRVYGYVPEGKKSFDEVNDFDILKSAVLGRDVDDLTLKEMKDVVEFVRKWENSYGVDMTTQVPCKFCNREVEVAIPFFLFLVKL